MAGPLMVIHRIKALADIEIMPGVYFSTTKNDIDSVMQSDSPDIRFFIGCAGWAQDNWSPRSLRDRGESFLPRILMCSTVLPIFGRRSRRNFRPVRFLKVWVSADFP